MVEIRYDENTGQLKLPKNIRQVGKSEGETKIYVEDYVITFLNQLANESPMEEKLAILLGYTVEKDRKAYVFIHGAVAVSDVNIQEDHIGFTSGIWSKIYEDIKTWFGEAKVAGWFLTRPGKPVRMTEKIKKVHVDNFPGEGKTMFVVDPLDKDETFFIYRKGELQRQGGYYIYYERNEEMQTYMIAYSKKQEEQDLLNKVLVEDRRGDREEIPENESKPKGNYNVVVKKMTRYAAVFVVLVAAVSIVTLMSQGSGGTGEVMSKVTETEQDAVRIETEGVDESSVDVISEGVTSETVTESEGFVSGWKHPESESATFVYESESQSQPTVSVMTSAINGTMYTISDGDTLAEISERFYDSMAYVDSICVLNEIEDPDKIYPGMTIVLP